MKMPKSFVVLICILALSVPLYGETADINLPALIKICESFEKAIVDVNMEFDLEVNSPPFENPDKNSAKFVGPQKCYFAAIKPFDQMYKLTMVIVSENIKGVRMGATTTEACNGEFYRESDRPAEDKKLLDYSILTPLGFTIFRQFYKNRTLLDELKDDSAYSLVLDPNISKVNDFNTVEVTLISKRSTIPYLRKMSFFFSVDHNYTMVKMVQYSGSSSFKVLQGLDIMQLKDLGGGIWFPAKACLIVDEAGLVNTFTINKIAINQGLTKKNLLYTDKKDANSLPQKN
jgi:hypothetical protein